MSAKNAVLGLVIEQPSYGYRIAVRFQERLGSAGFAVSNVYSALDRLEKEELVRVADEDGAGGGTTRSPRTRYEATPKGVVRFEEWLLSSSPAPPLRDELHMKIALCQPRNLPRLIELVYGQELACLGRVQDLKRSSEAAPPSSREWPRLMRVLAGDAEVVFWEARIVWLQSVRELLEQLHEESERGVDRQLRGV
jgi:DNA-binding PadR family transcriptional regulator